MSFITFLIQLSWMGSLYNMSLPVFHGISLMISQINLGGSKGGASMEKWWEQEWRSGESAHLPPVWPGFNSRTRRHMWVEFVVGSLLAPRRFSPGTPVILSSLPPRPPPVWPGFNSRTRHHMWVEFVVGSLLAARRFSPGSLVSPTHQKPKFLNSYSVRNSRATFLSVARLLGATLIKHD